MMLPNDSILLTLTVTSLLLVIPVSSGGSSANGNHEICLELKPLDYKIFSSFTLYETAREQLEKDNNLYKDFFGSRSLLEEHKSLLIKSCRPISFYFLGRHAARFVKGDKIDKFNKNLQEFAEKLKQQEAVNKCPKKFEELFNWSSKIVPKQGNMISSLGEEEEQLIASRFKAIYPEFFNTKTADIDIAVTSKIRTSQTGVQFLKLVDGFHLPPSCDSEHLPTNDVFDSKFNVDNITNSDCYKNLMEKEVEEFLQFHVRCKKSLKKSLKGKGESRENLLVKRAKSFEAVKTIVDKVSSKLGGFSIDQKLLNSIHQMCVLETSFKGESIWCKLLDESDVQVLNYIKDVGAYLEDSYGQDSNIKQACPLIKNILEKTQSIARDKASKKNVCLADYDKVKSYFYFTHDHVLKKVLATFNLFKDDASFSEQQIDELINKQTIPVNRIYRSSVGVPFSANFAFIQYECQNDNNKILIALNEKPIRIAGCDHVQCDLNKFIETYESANDCDMDKICPL